GDAANKVYYFPNGVNNHNSPNADSISATSSFSLVNSGSNKNTRPTGLVTRDGTYFYVADNGNSGNSGNRVFVYKKHSAGGGYTDANMDFLGAWTIDSRNGDATGITLNPASGGGSALWLVDRQGDRVYAYPNGQDYRSDQHD